MLNEQRHTPGPWGWDSRNGRHYLLTFNASAPHHIVLGRMSGIDPGDLVPDDAMGQADLALIAAAPQLLAMLKDMVAVFDFKSADPMKTYDPMQMVAMARAVIATAEGQ